MGWFHPAAVEHRRTLFTRPDRARYLRHDAHRFGPPKPQEKSWAARMVDAMRAEEAEAARGAEIEAFEAEHRALRRELAELKYELAWRALCRKAGFNPDQPRDELGRWTDAGGSSGDGGNEATDAGEQPSVSDANILSDANPDPITPGAQYAQIPIEVDPKALTGIPEIDRTTIALSERLAKVVDAFPGGSGPQYGIMIHTAFKASLLASPIPNVDIEPTFGGTGIYGSKDSTRPDVVLRNTAGDIIAFYDVKTGERGIDAPRASEFRTFSKPSAYVIELSLRRGILFKCDQLR
jgi:hypothetical protein